MLTAKARVCPRRTSASMTRQTGKTGMLAELPGSSPGVSGTTIILRTASAQGQARQTVTVSGHIQLTSQRLRRAALDGAD